MTDRSNLVEVLTENRNVPKEIGQYGFFVKADGTPDVGLVEQLTYLGQVRTWSDNWQSAEWRSLKKGGR